MPGGGVKAAIIDYGMGNLFSVAQACRRAGLEPVVTAERRDVAAAAAVILPGVGAFGDAMAALERLGLPDILREAAASGKPLMGICLGMQLLMSQSREFGDHRGLDILQGDVVRFEDPREGDRRLKVPQVGWNAIRPPENGFWDGSPLAAVKPGELMYFVHSFYVRPRDQSVVLSLSRYGNVEFCSAVRRGSLFACQFHPERSGPAGLRIYEAFAAQLGDQR